MVTGVDTAALRRLLDDGDVQLVEVLPADDYDEEHLPGAVNVPLADLTADGLGRAGVDLSRPIVVYGFDSECDRSPRAAARLEALGATTVHDFGPGKVAWLAEGLPSEGRRTPEQRVSAIADPDVPLVPGTATVGEAEVIVRGAGADLGIVVDDELVVLGVVRSETFGLPADLPVADVLQPGPSTFRPSMTIAELVSYFEDSDEQRAIVSTLGGRWIGLIRRSDVLDG
jgi:rhodanese-related sulfurtransferase